jgi:hypothetical protein
MEDIKVGESNKKILQMLADGKINVDEAERLMKLVDNDSDRESNRGGQNWGMKVMPRYMHVIVEPKTGAGGWDNEKDARRDKVNVRVPFNLIRAGMKLMTLIPSDAADQVDKAFKEKGFSFDVRRVKEEDLEQLVTALQESHIDVETDAETIKIYAE